jgi:hypothetical protein
MTRIPLWLLALGLVFGACSKDEGDDDSAVGDDDVGDDDVADDDAADDDAADDDSATADDDDSAAGDDDDTSGPPLLDVEVTWLDTEVPGNPDPTLTMEDLGGGDLLVNLDAWHLNCCIDLIVGAAMPRTGMCRVNLDDIGKPCYCESGMDVDVTVHGVPVGPLDVTVLYAGLDVATGEIEMGL